MCQHEVSQLTTATSACMRYKCYTTVTIVIHCCKYTMCTFTQFPHCSVSSFIPALRLCGARGTRVGWGNRFADTFLNDSLEILPRSNLVICCYTQPSAATLNHLLLRYNRLLLHSKTCCYTQLPAATICCCTLPTARETNRGK